jgi:tungstate transport system substrate-binding protein
VQNAGLLHHLLPPFENEAAISIRVHAAGSGRALQMLEKGTVDVVISHAPDAEQRLLHLHPEWSYRKLAYNWFVVVGPASDPAQLRTATDVVQAFQRIADSDAVFVSRGDESGTHERERTCWKAAGRRPSIDRLIVSGGSMAQALRHADQMQGYTLTDDPTFRQLSSRLELQVVFEGDARLLNTYAVIHRADRPDAAAFATWLLSPATRGRLASFLIEGRPGFEPWPEGCASGAPADSPCINTRPPGVR